MLETAMSLLVTANILVGLSLANPTDVELRNKALFHTQKAAVYASGVTVLPQDWDKRIVCNEWTDGTAVAVACGAFH